MKMMLLMTRRKVKKSEVTDGDVQYVDKQRGIAVVLEGEGGDLKGNTGKVYYKTNK